MSYQLWDMQMLGTFPVQINVRLWGNQLKKSKDFEISFFSVTILTAKQHLVLSPSRIFYQVS